MEEPKSTTIPLGEAYDQWTTLTNMRIEDPYAKAKRNERIFLDEASVWRDLPPIYISRCKLPYRKAFDVKIVMIAKQGQEDYCVLQSEFAEAFRNMKERIDTEGKKILEVIFEEIRSKKEKEEDDARAKAEATKNNDQCLKEIRQIDEDIRSLIHKQDELYDKMTQRICKHCHHYFASCCCDSNGLSTCEHEVGDDKYEYGYADSDDSD
jgi:hypothetical protein